MPDSGTPSDWVRSRENDPEPTELTAELRLSFEVRRTLEAVLRGQNIDGETRSPASLSRRATATRNALNSVVGATRMLADVAYNATSPAWNDWSEGMQVLISHLVPFTEELSQRVAATTDFHNRTAAHLAITVGVSRLVTDASRFGLPAATPLPEVERGASADDLASINALSSFQSSVPKAAGQRQTTAADMVHDAIQAYETFVQAGQALG